MPELPEVETIRSDLVAGGVVGRRLVSVDLQWPGAVQRLGPEEFVVRLSAPVGDGKAILGVGRRGKYLLLALDSGETLIVHLGMTGRLLLRQSEDPLDPHVRAVFRLDDRRELRFADARKFGKLWLVDDAARVIGKLGPEPLEIGFTVAELVRGLGKRRAPLKAVLLDQGTLAGLGNIYADEALFLAHLHPLRPANSLSPEEMARLHEAIRHVLAEGIANRGTTFATYVSAQGQAGHNQEALRVYRRTGRPCPVCASPIQRLVVGGRSTHFCTECQTC